MRKAGKTEDEIRRLGFLLRDIKPGQKQIVLRPGVRITIIAEAVEGVMGKVVSGVIEDESPAIYERRS